MCLFLFAFFYLSTEVFPHEWNDNTLLLFALEVCIKFTMFVIITLLFSRTLYNYAFLLVITLCVLVGFAICLLGTKVFTRAINRNTLLIPTLQMRVTIRLGSTLFRTRSNDHDALFVIITFCVHNTFIGIFTEISPSTKYFYTLIHFAFCMLCDGTMSIQ